MEGCGPRQTCGGQQLATNQYRTGPRMLPLSVTCVFIPNLITLCLLLCSAMLCSTYSTSLALWRACSSAQQIVGLLQHFREPSSPPG